MTEGFSLEPPSLQPHEGSWIVKRIADGVVLGEFFEADNVRKFNGAKCEAIPIGKHLANLNSKTPIKLCE